MNLVRLCLFNIFQNISYTIEKSSFSKAFLFFAVKLVWKLFIEKIDIHYPLFFMKEAITGILFLIITPIL